MISKFVNSPLPLENPIIVNEGESFIVGYTDSLYPFVININGYTLKRFNQENNDINALELPPFSFSYFPEMKKIKARLF